MPPFVLLALEIVLAVFTTVYKCLMDAKPQFDIFQHGQDLNYLVAATFVSVAATSLVSTLFICREIYKHTMPGSSSRKHHRTIIILLIESSAAYSAAVLFLAVVNGIVTGSSQSAFISYIISNYGSAVAQIVSGMAPTIMIARLSLSSSHKPTEVSSATARLPSDVVNYAPNPLERENGWADLEMQQGDFQQPVDEEGAESIVVVSRSSNSARYQPQVCIEDRAYSSVYSDTADGKNRSSLVA
ncbi:hypothetical protein CPC08DRAFT_771548 [Agrocybe pediades]|nr:hypothetical protein CPC08DRAFT_771548 [Agrocybe pediades]